MKVLLVGGGAREHAIAWKLASDDPSVEIVAAPGNPGIASRGRCVALRADDVAMIVALADAERPDIIVVGPEAPLAAGLGDALRARGHRVFGPDAAAARIESSKSFAKEIMRSAGVPTARASRHTTLEGARRAIVAAGAPIVIKASGLAAGKGVIVASSVPAAVDAAEHLLASVPGGEVLVEEFMDGEELSLLAITDGIDAVPLLGAQDHKRLGDGDTGPNTGGMGAYAPVSIDTAALSSDVMERVILPTLRTLRAGGAPFRGVLYAGLMITSTGPRVVEFNCRFGDPETEALLPLMSSSLLEPMLAVASGAPLTSVPAPRWRAGASVTTIVAAAGYPDAPRTGEAIGLPDVPSDTYVFHAGTRLRDDGVTLESAGGRVLAITSLGATLRDAAEASARCAASVELADKQFRRDIGWRDLARATDA